MNIGKTMFALVIEFVPWTSFSTIVTRYAGNAGVHRLTCAEQFRAMALAQLIWRITMMWSWRDLDLLSSRFSAFSN